jgi:hypothetical protein
LKSEGGTLKQLVIPFYMIMVLFAGAIRGTPQEEELKATHTLLQQAVEGGNIPFLKKQIHPRSLGFMRASQFPVQLRMEYSVSDAIPAISAELAQFVTTPYEKVYRVVGDTGIVCATSHSRARPGTEQADRFNRAMFIYARLGGIWKLVGWHTSETPLKPK